VAAQNSTFRCQKNKQFFCGGVEFSVFFLLMICGLGGSGLVWFYVVSVWGLNLFVGVGAVGVMGFGVCIIFFFVWVVCGGWCVFFRFLFFFDSFRGGVLCFVGIWGLLYFVAFCGLVVSFGFYTQRGAGDKHRAVLCTGLGILYRDSLESNAAGEKKNRHLGYVDETRRSWLDEKKEGQSSALMCREN